MPFSKGLGQCELGQLIWMEKCTFYVEAKILLLLCFYAVILVYQNIYHVQFLLLVVLCCNQSHHSQSTEEETLLFPALRLLLGHLHPAVAAILPSQLNIWITHYPIEGLRRVFIPVAAPYTVKES